ncbi:MULTISPECIES: thioesterase family protein [unclassified Sphingomonas]|jgi:acyl-CoA thioester hydrolase|uniref:acyl-CoA thioesterase n=1 Tax=unclassified Sphingomonas TaxID=196159 RepID=UPI0016157275|nr:MULTISPECIES: thioesterase family protein [unclassified Sphingomonas]MBB3349758.1 acyl-CoA thioester hydrolase [Sphingomonas sp. BK069]MBB3475762.1 acyl-CoA thioester hydrolase [Sphingomonas sp. BK345]
MTAHAHEYPVHVADEDIDFMGHVNNAVYLKWVQAAVMDYWERVAPPEAVAQHLWVALKHEITYRRPTFLEDGIVAEVIAEKAQGARTFFSTLFKRGEEIVAEVSSVWCCLDAATQRPARLAKDVIARFVAEPGTARG